MTAEELSAQLSSASNILRTAKPFIDALWAAYDAKPVTSGIDPAAVQPAIDELTNAATDLVNTINARAVPSNAAGA